MLNDLGISGDEGTGAQIMKKALERPLKLISENTGVAGEVILAESQKSEGDWGYDEQDSEARIRELFEREYVIPVAVDGRVASIARSLVKKYRSDPGKLKPADAAHLATAIPWDIPVIETTDTDLLRLNGLEGSPPITIRRPLYEGPERMPGV